MKLGHSSRSPWVPELTHAWQCMQCLDSEIIASLHDIDIAALCSGRDEQILFTRPSLSAGTCPRSPADILYNIATNMPVSDEQITTRLQELLETVNLETTSGKAPLPGDSMPLQCPQQCSDIVFNVFDTFAERKLREILEAEFKEDLKDRKAIIRQEVCKHNCT